MVPSTKILIFVNILIYIGHLTLNGLSARASQGNKLFPNTVSEISKHFDLEMTPIGTTFSIWGVIFTWQLGWMLYTAVNVFRSGAGSNILSNKFFIAFILNIIFVSTWLFTWSRKEGVASFVVILIGQILVDLAIAQACYDLNQFTGDGKADIWTQRILVQNGLLFYGTWTTIATLINFAVVLAYYVGTTTRVASLISLSLLGVLAATWFVLESFVFHKYTEYTFSAYIVLMIGLTGILVNIFDLDKVVGGLTLALLILSAVFFIARIAIIIVRSMKNKVVNESNQAIYGL